jgi:hypothetical protein
VYTKTIHKISWQINGRNNFFSFLEYAILKAINSDSEIVLLQL